MIETERLILRPWKLRDRAPFAALNADPAVMEYFPTGLTRAESDATITRMEDRRAREGFTFDAVERRADGVFLGMVGLARATFDAPVCPCVEIGWRLAPAHWGQGYATEAARAWLGYGFDALECDEIVAFSVPANARSHAVMRRIGMTRDPARDFEHPALPQGHALRPHVLHAITRAAFEAGRTPRPFTPGGSRPSD